MTPKNGSLSLSLWECSRDWVSKQDTSQPWKVNTTQSNCKGYVKGLNETRVSDRI